MARFSDLPDDAQRAFTLALRHMRRRHPEFSAAMGTWSDLAEQVWTDTMQSARPDVVGWQRAKGLVVGARLVVWTVACGWARAGTRKRKRRG